MREWMCLLLTMFLLVGCSHGPTALSADDKKKAGRELAEKFGKALVAKDYAAAYGMLSQEHQGRLSQDQFKAGYEKVKGEARCEPTKVATDSGSLPSSQEDAKRTYGIPDTVKQETWVAWVFSELTSDRSGFEGRLLIVDEGGQMKIGSLEWGPIS